MMCVATISAALDMLRISSTTTDWFLGTDFPKGDYRPGAVSSFPASETYAHLPSWSSVSFYTLIKRKRAVKGIQSCESLKILLNKTLINYQEKRSFTVDKPGRLHLTQEIKVNTGKRERGVCTLSNGTPAYHSDIPA